LQAISGVQEIVWFFEMGDAPVDSSETVETLAFIEAAGRSRVGGELPAEFAPLPAGDLPRKYSTTRMEFSCIHVADL